MARTKVMIVEDEIIVGKDIQMSLKNLGYSVSSVVASGEKAIKKVEKEKPDLVLMDVVLRGEMDGIEAAEQIKCRFNIPVIYLTAYSDEEMLKRAKITEPYGYLLKPIDHRELHTTIEIALYKAEMEEKVRESEERYRTLLEISPDVIYTLSSKNEIILSLSPSFEMITGWSCAEWTGKPFSAIIHPDDVTAAAKQYQEVLNGKKTAPFELRVLSKSGEYLVGEFIYVPRINNGEVVSILGVARDITNRKKMEEELLKVKKLQSIGVLARGIAHDFNDLLAVIMGNTSLGKLYVKPGDKIFEILKKVEEASFKAKDLTSRLLNFARGGVTIKKTSVISDLLKDTTNFALSGSNIKCEFFIPDKLWPVKIDEGQISQVMANVVTNARETMPNGGIIRVRAENVTVDRKRALPLKEGKHVMISIEDEGKGIPEEHLGRIFDPYFSTKEMGTQKGMGLGLAISHSIIKQHDGHISVESEVGVGTTIYISFPASQEEITDREVAAEKPVVGKGKILFMDENEIVRESTGKLLGRLGYEVEYARDGVEAVDLYKKARESESRFDAVILDLTVRGGLGGKETIKKLLEIDPNVKAIISSGYYDNPAMEEYHKYGFCGAIVKPYNIQDLSEILSNVILV